jgi:hypothetical protein
VGYCTKPESIEREAFGIEVPGPYLTCGADEDGAYACEPNRSGTVAGYTSSTAPIGLTVNTPRSSAQTAPTSYEYAAIAAYFSAGYAYGIVTFGRSVGGAQRAVAGASVESALYAPYLESISAGRTAADGSPLSAALFGAMAWCRPTQHRHRVSRHVIACVRDIAAA